jgi:hypothetical protein
MGRSLVVSQFEFSAPILRSLRLREAQRERSINKNIAVLERFTAKALE